MPRGPNSGAKEIRDGPPAKDLVLARTGSCILETPNTARPKELPAPQSARLVLLARRSGVALVARPDREGSQDGRPVEGH
jgi:hypothetical protein